jgi:DNA-binding ferritin-like protein
MPPEQAPQPPPDLPGPSKDPYSGLHAEAIYAMWHDPIAYDHMKMGPPYLPEMKVRFASTDQDAIRKLVKAETNAAPLTQIFSHLLGEYQGLPMAELAVLLSCLRAASLVHQTHHWQTRGNTFYGDHLLYERLYNESQPAIDGLAERAVGSGGHLLVHPAIQAGQLNALVKFFIGDLQTNASVDEYVRVSLGTEVQVLAVLALVYELLEGKQELSHGTDNLLQGIADKHEEFVYLLRQRSSIKLSYARR